MKDILIAAIPTIGTIIVALLTLFTNRKIEKNKELKEEILKEVQKSRDDNKKEISDHILDNDKTYLTDFMSDIEAGEPKAEIQIMRAKEIKQDYNRRGGDSYVDDKWEELKNKGLLKERKVI